MRQDPALRRLVDSVLVTGFDGTAPPAWLLRRLEGGLGGVCWFAQNVTDPEQAGALAEALHCTRSEVLVMTDEEGGEVTRLEAAVGSSWPGHATLGALDDPATTRTVAEQLGRQLLRAGVDIALAPVVDVNSNPANPVIGVRSFGATADLVARHAVPFVEGVQSSGVAACAKHYPGHGATGTDSHLGLPRVDDAHAVLMERDVAPFAAVVAAGVRCVMTAHVVFTAVDERPATMSPVLLRQLRDRLAFEGLVISDALDMRAISHGVGRGEGAVRSLIAGVDLLCIGNPMFPDRYDAEARLDEIADAVAEAVDRGRLPAARLEDAAARVAELAGWTAAARSDERSDRPGPDLGVGLAAASRAIRVTGDVAVASAPLVLDLGGEINLAAGRRAHWIIEILRQRDATVTVVDIDSVAEAATTLESTADRPVVALVRAPGRSEVDDVLDAVLRQRRDAVVVHTGPADGASDAGRAIHTFGGGRAVAEAVADLIVGRGEA